MYKRLSTLQNITSMQSTDHIQFLCIIGIFTPARNCRSQHATASLSCKLNYLLTHRISTQFLHHSEQQSCYISVYKQHSTKKLYSLCVTSSNDLTLAMASASDKTCNCKVKVNKQLLMLQICYLFLHSHVQQPCYIAAIIQFHNNDRCSFCNCQTRT